MQIRFILYEINIVHKLNAILSQVIFHYVIYLWKMKREGESKHQCDDDYKLKCSSSFKLEISDREKKINKYVHWYLYMHTKKKKKIKTIHNMIKWIKGEILIFPRNILYL